MATLEFSNVSKAFGVHSVIKDVSLSIEDGEFAVFVGPSGCGKSTLLRLVAGLDPVTEGKVLIDGVDVTRRQAGQRPVAMVFQSYALYPHMSVFENIAFPLQMERRPRQEIRAEVEKAAATVQLETRLGDKPSKLSGGQRQRVAIARAIVRKPEIFLMDEPLSNLDAALRGEMRSEIIRLHRRLGATMIYVTHDQLEAMTMADRIVVLNAGKVEQVGAPMDLYQRPDNLFVAGFIGSPPMNFLHGVVSSSANGQTTVEVAGVGLVGLKTKRILKKGEAVTVGVRPESLSNVSHSEPEMTFTIVCETIERMGLHTQVHGELEGKKVTGLFNGDHVFDAGERVTVHAPLRQIHLFDEEGSACSAFE